VIYQLYNTNIKTILKEVNIISQTLSDKAYEIIKDKIIEFKNEEFISLRKMVQELDMSYTPTREAFQRLEREGFLKLVPNVGYFINKLDIEEIIKIYQVRECLEVFVFEKVFDSITKENIDTLSNYLEEQINNYKKKDFKNYYINDEHFHRVFFEIYDNPYLTKMIDNVREKYLIGSTETIFELKKREVVEAIEEHKKLIRFIKEGNKEKSIEMMVTHIENSKNRVKEGYFLFS
jgi:GntR family transcriptional regulator, rspAB operon transcriptional repressor